MPGKRGIGSVAVTGCLLLAACSTGVPGTPEERETTSGGPVVSWEEQLAGLAQLAGITDPPEVEPVRTISPQESQQVVQDCLVDEGWLPGDDGTFSMPQEQREAFLLSEYVCTARYPIDERYLEPLTDQQWAIVYEHWRDEFYPCLRGAGLTPPVLTSRESFLADPYAWHPEGAGEVTLAEQFRAVRGPDADYDRFKAEECPISPPQEVLYP